MKKDKMRESVAKNVAVFKAWGMSAAATDLLVES